MVRTLQWTKVGDGLQCPPLVLRQGLRLRLCGFLGIFLFYIPLRITLVAFGCCMPWLVAECLGLLCLLGVWSDRRAVLVSGVVRPDYSWVFLDSLGWFGIRGRVVGCVWHIIIPDRQLYCARKCHIFDTQGCNVKSISANDECKIILSFLSLIHSCRP